MNSDTSLIKTPYLPNLRQLNLLSLFWDLKVKLELILLACRLSLETNYDRTLTQLNILRTQPEKFKRGPFKKFTKKPVNKDIICHRCGLAGHVKKDCRVKAIPSSNFTRQ